MKVKLTIVDGERTRGASSNPVTSWRFRISFGARSVGMVSEKSYKSVDGAYNAGLRAAKKIDPSFKD